MSAKLGTGTGTATTLLPLAEGVATSAVLFTTTVLAVPAEYAGAAILQSLCLD